MAQKLLKWFVLLALVLFIAAIVIFLFGKPSFSEDQVILGLEGPTQASGGDEVVYKVKYGNQTKLELHDLRFKFTYPDSSVVIKNGQVTEELSEVFAVDTLGDGESGEREFKAFLVGDRGNIKNAKVELEFRAGNLRSSFEKTDTISTTLVSIPISLTLVAPPSVISGQTINYILDYRNESGENISDIRLEFDYPDGFAVLEQTPTPSLKASEGKVAWPVPLLRKDEGGRISIRGTLTGREGDIKTISVVLKRGINGEFIDYQKAATSSLISNPLLGLDVLVNGFGDYSAHLDDRLQYTIRYRNNSTSNLIGLNLQVKLEGEMYDIETLNTDGGFYDSSNNTILWNAAVVSDFSALSPNKSGEIKFSVNIKKDFPSGGVSGRNFFVKASANLRTPNIPSGSGVESDEISATADLITRISTQPSLLQTAFYNDPAFGSSGPLPPKTGEETTFTVHWQISNPSNDMNNVEIIALLPPGVVWKDIVSVGLGQSEPTYDPNSSEIRWNIGVLPQGTGVLTPNYEASFQVSIKPSVAGQTPTLIKDGRFSGTDSFTKEQIILNVQDLTTSNPVDRPGEGTVE